MASFAFSYIFACRFTRHAYNFHHLWLSQPAQRPSLSAPVI
jgi:hypothetical protein